MAEKEPKQTFNTKLHEICSDNKLQPVMQCVYFDNGFAYASNAHIAIKQSLDFQSVLAPEELDGKFLHKDNFKAVMTFEIAECCDDGIQCKSISGAAAFFEYYIPKIDEKIPEFEKMLHPKRGQTAVTFIGFNPEYFAKLTKALYAPMGNIRCKFTGVDSGILVDVVGIEDQQAIIMPYILNDSLF